jgi:uncharacterized protein (TIGR02996 family)
MSGQTARGFLEDIIAHPDDDAPRLIFADWLEEHGEIARAEFLRVQIERARLPEWDARQVRLRLREKELLEQHERKWKAELPRIRGISWEEFRRGFVATVTVSSFAVLKENASVCWAAAPIEAVSVRRWPQRRDSMKSIEPIAGLRVLSINASFVRPQEIDLFTEAPLLSTLQALNVRLCNLGAEGFRRLVDSPHLGNLTALRVPFNSIGNGGVNALLHSGSLKSLVELDLSETGSYGRYGEDPILDAAGLEALAAWPGMSRLRSLVLSGNDVRREGLRALLRSPRVSSLKELVLRRNGLDGPAMLEFASARPELQLDVLDLGENLLGDLGAKHLASAPCLGQLKVLNLDRCEMLLSAAHHLAWAPFLGSFRRLNVNHNSFGPKGLQALLEQKPQQLHTLQLVDNDLGDEGVSHLAGSPASDTLLKVNLAQNGLKKRAALALARTKHLRDLLVLRLNDNPISMAAGVDLAESPLGKRLAVLEMEDENEEEDEDGLPF